MIALSNACTHFGLISGTDCRRGNVCGDNAQCLYDELLREYVCECVDDFSGDGYSCERVGKSFSIIME